MLCNFFPITIIFFYVYDFTDIDECKGNHSCHVNATYKNILGSHIRQCQAGYTGNGRNCTGEINLFAIILRIVLHHDTFNYSAAPFSGVARQLDNLFGQLFDRKDLFKKCGRIGISRTKLNDTIDLLSTYPRQFNW